MIPPQGLALTGKAFFGCATEPINGAFWTGHKKTALGANPGGFCI
jgi:hypothetical protein